MGNFWSEFESLLESKTFMVLFSRTRIRPDELRKLRKGDHIGWHRLYKGIWHHAIVDEIDEKKKRLRIHVFHNQKKGMVHEWVNVEEETDDMFRFDYPKKVTDENGPFVVLQRAAELLEDCQGYNLVTNNCEHSASFCKTGVKKSMQVRWVLAKALESICNALTAMKMNPVKKMIGVEIVNLLYDIYRIYLKKRDGEMSGEDFEETVIQRVTEALRGVLIGILGSCGGAYGGAYIGTLIPLLGPILGSYAGSLLGGWCGSFLGKLVGSHLGYIIAKLVREFMSSLTSELGSLNGVMKKMKRTPIA